ncbi:MOSC domain-containing protein [Pseudorhizobium marinum]|uniref:MOSC domain-containing protein n=1 Tax=Pseudorhizobium marinum TaxID=1496690 RepID=UPI000496D6EB|nr:MOSC domain-containing protein [Pseudorhizobium marinum]
MKLTAICLGRPEVLAGKSYKTGINKTALNVPIVVDAEGLVGDAVCNRKHHGGPDQAILLEGSLTLDWWAAELGRDLPPGAFGENLIVEGLDNREVSVGDRFHFDGVVLEASSARIPCATFAAKIGDPMFVKRYAAAGRPGIYCRVLQGGMLAAGEAVRCEPYDGERVLMPEILSTFGRKMPADVRARFMAAPIASRLRALVEAA